MRKPNGANFLERVMNVWEPERGHPMNYRAAGDDDATAQRKLEARARNMAQKGIWYEVVVPSPAAIEEAEFATRVFADYFSHDTLPTVNFLSEITADDAERQLLNGDVTTLRDDLYTSDRHIHGSYVKKSDVINLNIDLIDDRDQLRSVVAHEMMHRQQSQNGYGSFDDNERAAQEFEASYLDGRLSNEINAIAVRLAAPAPVANVGYPSVRNPSARWLMTQ